MRRSFHDRITGLLDAHLSFTSNRLNQVMKTLTIISTIFLPLTVLTGMFGMNVTFPLFPGGEGLQFWWIFAIMLAIVGLMLWFFTGPSTDDVLYAASASCRHELANQIAAGEVVERPASVVKELVENALDAGARRIAITIELGGKKLVRVEDDGGGMSPDDARARAASATPPARSRGATISPPSARSASAARRCRRSRRCPASCCGRGRAAACPAPRSASTAARMAPAREVGAPEGTRIEVGDLFFNLPARRKFLKADAAESAQITRLVTQIALGYLDVGVTLISARAPRPAMPAGGVARDRIYQVLGERPDLIELFRESAGIRITGFVAALAEQGPVRGPQHVFVNRRIVRDRSLQHAITDAYSTATIRERSPEVHLFLELAPDRVDVNVHPTKAEVRFLEPGAGARSPAPGADRRLGKPAVPSLRLGGAGPAAGWRGRRPGRGRVGVAPADRLASLPGVFGEPLGAGALLARDGLAVAMTAAGPAPIRGRTRRSAPARQRIAGRRLAAGEQPAAGLVDRRGAVDPVRPMVPLGQLRDTFIVAIDSEGLLIVNQHVAHERILYEQVLERLTSRALESQRLLTPLVLELSPAQVEALGGRGEDLARLGFEIEPFGDRTVHVAAVPSIVQGGSRGGGDPRPRRRPRRPRSRRAGGGRGQAPRRDDRLPRGGEGARSAVDREDAVPARRAAPHRLLDDLSARASGAAATHAARDRTRLRSRLIAGLCKLLGARSEHAKVRAVFDWCTQLRASGCARAHKSSRFCLTPRSRGRSVRTLQ